MEDRRRHNTVRQLEVMLEFLEGNRDLALGRIRSKVFRVVAQRLWRECAELLNPLGPARTGKEWSKVWNDQKTKVRAKLMTINTSQRATGGGPSNAPTLTPLEERVANIIGRDVGPLPNVAQDHFAVSEGDGLNVAEEVIEESGNISPIILNIPAEIELPSTSGEPEVPELVPPIEPPPQTQSEPFSTPADRTRRMREHRRARVLRPVRASARSPVPPQGSADPQQPPQTSSTTRASLEESRAMVLRCEVMRAQAALQNAQAANLNAQAFNTLADAFKLIAVSVDRLSQQYSATQSSPAPVVFEPPTFHCPGDPSHN